MTKDDDTFFFIKNLQGDVTKIIDEDGEICATYAYDAWGALLAQNEDSSIEGLNPFRYRGYVYDTETQLYYLQSRYYDPKTGRFINADDSAYTDTYSGSPLSTNMFAYCENNAVNELDYDGYWLKKYHVSVTQNAHFPQLVYQTAGNADSYPFGNKPNYYSAPFHSRGNTLEVSRRLYNLAIQIKKNKKTKKIYIDKNHKKDGMVNLSILKYESRGNINETRKAQNECEKQLNVKKNNWKKQYQLFLGLSLHAVQDYFAHKVRVYKCLQQKGGTGKYIDLIEKYNKIDKRKGSRPITDVNYWITPGETYAIEDNPDFLSWRDSSTKAITEGLYKYFNKGSEIKSIKAEQLYQNSHSFYIYYKKKWHYTTKKPKQKYDAYKMTYGNVVLSFSFK